MRALLASLVLLAAVPAACVGALGDAVTEDLNPEAPGAGTALCIDDSDCVPAGATCCGCPTFAVTRDDPVARACSNVHGPGCPPAECTENVIARCNEDLRCELACAPRACAASCPYGFATDPSGCLTCECAVPPPGGCVDSAECTRTRADCCGCQRGGKDTAVLATERASHEAMVDAMLMCAAQPACPEIDTCTADVPTCVAGRCDLVSPDLPDAACGRDDLPACAPGTQCMVNVSDQANMHAVGVCAPAP